MPYIPKGFRIANLYGEVNANDVAINDEYALFGDEIVDSNDYLRRMSNEIKLALTERRPFPVVRFADGEFRLYSKSLMVNGLYEQARNVEEIVAALPWHIESLKYIAATGRLCPITYLYNIQWVTYNDCIAFYKFLEENGAELTPANYYPFYLAYHFLTSVEFMHMIDGKNVLIVSDEFNTDAVAKWTAQFHVSPNYKVYPIPSRWVAVHYKEYLQTKLIDAIQKAGDVDIALVAAGAGAAPVCADIAKTLNVPAIDAGHILNLMNNRVARSGGHRMFTFKGIYK